MPHLEQPFTLDIAVQQLLELVNVGDCDQEILHALRSEAVRLLTRIRPSSPAMSPDVRAYLVKADAFTAEELAETEERVARGELRDSENLTRLETIAASYGESEAARRLGVQRDELRRRRRDGAVYAFDVSDVTVYPRWQFTDQTDNGLLPHLAHVVASLIEDWNPASVEGFMTVPKDDLIHRGKWQSPVEWLLRGASPRRIDMILEGVRWR